MKYSLAIAAFLAICVSAFAVTVAVADSGGSSASSNLPSDLPVASVPATALDPATTTSLQGSLFWQFTSTDLANARELGTTDVGPMYVLPDSQGDVCLAINGALSCGESPDLRPNKADGPFSADADGNLVGGGIVSAGVTNVELTDGSTTVQAELVPGGYIIPASDDLPFPSVAGPHVTVSTTS